MELNNLNSSGVQRSEFQNNRIWSHSFWPILKIKIKVTSISLDVHPPLSMTAESLFVVEHCGTIGYPWTVQTPLFSHIALRLLNAPVESRKNWTPARNDRVPTPLSSLSFFCVRWKRELSLQTIIFSNVLSNFTYVNEKWKIIYLTAEKDMNVWREPIMGFCVWLIIAVIHTTWKFVKLKPEKNSGLNGIRTHDLCDTVQCSTDWAIKLSGSWSNCEFVIYPYKVKNVNE